MNFPRISFNVHNFFLMQPIQFHPTHTIHQLNSGLSAGDPQRRTEHTASAHPIHLTQGDRFAVAVWRHLFRLAASYTSTAEWTPRIPIYLCALYTSGARTWASARQQQPCTHIRNPIWFSSVPLCTHLTGGCAARGKVWTVAYNATLSHKHCAQVARRAIYIYNTARFWVNGSLLMEL